MIGIALLGIAHAATLTVPGDYAELDEAIQAASAGDVIEVGPGTWTGPFRPSVDDLTIRGTGGSQVTLLQSFDNFGATVALAFLDLTLEGVSVLCTSRGAIESSQANLTLTDVRVEDCYDSPVSPIQLDGGANHVLTATDLHLGFLPPGVPALWTDGVQTSFQGVQASGGTGSGPVLDIHGGNFTVSDITISDVDTTGCAICGTQLTSASVSRLAMSCGSTGQSAVDLDAITIAGEAWMIWKVDAGDAPTVTLDGSSVLKHLTVVGEPGQTSIFQEAGTLALTDSAFAASTAAVEVGAGVTASGSYNLYGPNVAAAEDPGVAGALSGTGTLNADPVFASFEANGPCAADVLAPYVGSPLIDAATPGGFDVDGSPSDIGATGGLLGFQLYEGDADGDGSPDGEDCAPLDAKVSPYAQEVPYDGIDQDCDGEDLTDVDLDGFASAQVGGRDCNDQDPEVHPDAEEDLSAVDRDCDGFRDPVGPILPVGCTTAPTAPAWLWAPLFLCLWTFRRET